MFTTQKPLLWSDVSSFRGANLQDEHASAKIGLDSKNMQRKKATRQAFGTARLESALKDLAEVVHSLHQLLESYGPRWYTSETNARIRTALSNADSALRSSADRQPDLHLVSKGKNKSVRPRIPGEE